MIYEKYYRIKCPNCGYKESIIQHFKWDNSEVYEIGVLCSKCSNKFLIKPEKDQVQLSKEMQKIIIDKWVPEDKFYKSPSFNKSFIKNLGGENFSDLWTKRVLYILSLIFNEIIEEKNEDIKKQLLFGFIQSIHLCSKMCVPRREKANRSFSTSWGRAAYICSKRQMEMNPLLVFNNNCIGKQSVQSAMENVTKHIGKIPKILYVDKSTNTIIDKEDFDIKYGIIDIKDINDFLNKDSVKFIITDPPYGGLVQYLDLSQVWLIWLKKYDERFSPNVSSEITIKEGQQDIRKYSRNFANGIKNLYRVLNKDGKIVFTFHNKDLMIWNAFLRSLSEGGFEIEKVIHQQNRRSGESNVANPYGTSASDFYIRCSKTKYVKRIKITKDEFENFVVDRAVKIIKSRNEPTPYQILFNGLLSEISKAGFDLEKFDENISIFLKKHAGDVFKIIFTNELSGDLWWLHESYNERNINIPLGERVETTVKTLFEKRITLTMDEVLAEIFINYPNGLTPDIKKIDYYIKKFANKTGQKWKYNGK